MDGIRCDGVGGTDGTGQDRVECVGVELVGMGWDERGG